MSSLKKTLDEGVLRRAKDLAWNKLSKSQQNKLLKQALEIRMKELMEFVVEDEKKIEAAMSDPNYVSVLESEITKNDQR